MGAVDLWPDLSREVIEAGFKLAKKQARDRSDESFELAVDYMEGRQLSDVEAELQQRYTTTQGNTDTRIRAIAIPLVERFVDEQATAYNKPPKYELVNENGEVQATPTEALHRLLGESSYVERMHRLDRFAIALRVCCLWYQAKRGKLRPVITFPHLVYPVPPLNDPQMDPADQEDYLAHIVQLSWSSEDYSVAVGRMYAYLARNGTLIYQSSDPYRLGDVEESIDNPFTWPQTIDDGRGRGVVKDAPLQMLTYWHRMFPVKDLIPNIDHDLVELNREINVQLSVLLHTARTQGWSQMFLHLMDAKNAPAQIANGASLAIPLEVGESAEAVTMPNDYNGLVNALLQVVKIAALANRLSPNDFATEGAAPQSGFAKLIESLPKMQARDERLMRLKATEENIAWPRIGAIGRYLGVLPAGVERLKMRVTYADVEFPEAPTEAAQRRDSEYKWGLSTPAIELAKQLGITEEEAKQKIDERKATMPQQQQAPAQGMGGGLGRLGSLIGQRGNPDQNQGPQR